MAGLSPEQWQALSPHLDKALDMTDDERAAWLSSLHIEDPTLASQLQQLLESHRALVGDGFLNASVKRPETSGLAGQTIGAYTLISQIGQGGMGTVWLAQRSDGRFERRVAVKFLNIALLGKIGEERFRREGLILGRLAHPHIAELIDAGVSATGQPYLVLEHVQGGHIDAYCDRLALDISSRVRLFLGVLEAVEHAHSNLIVHRDLKPSNVLVRDDGQVKLLDFGIAKLLEIEDGAEETQLTLEGGRALTPEFAAPEQLNGQAVTTATDVYALGVLLYVLLTGEHPTGTKTRSPAELIKAVLDTEPVRPSEVVARTSGREEVAQSHATHRSATPEKLSRTLRGDLDTIVTTAVKKVPGERYSSAKAFADDLRRYLQNEPISARPDSIAYRFGKFARRHRGGIAASSAVILVLILASIATWFVSHREVPLRQINQRRLTVNPPDLPILNAEVSPSGVYVGYADQQGIHVQQVDGGSSQPVKLPPEVQDDNALRIMGGWYPDSHRFLVAAEPQGKSAVLSAVSLVGEDPDTIATIDQLSGPPRVSPDGRWIAYLRVKRTRGAGEIWLMGSHGESPHLVKAAEPQSSFAEIAWSPSGKRLVYTNISHKADIRDVSIKSCDLEGRNINTLAKEYRLDGFAWTFPNRLIYSRTVDPGGTESDNLLQVDVNENGVPLAQPKRLTDWSGFFATGFSSSSDGKHLAFLRGNSHLDISTGDLPANDSKLLNARQLPMDETYNIPLTWFPDSREIIFSSKHANDRLVYRQAIDGKSPARLLTESSGMSFYFAQSTPDGSAALLEGSSTGKFEGGIYRAEFSGGSPRLLFRTDDFVMYYCSRAPANLCVLGRMETKTSELVIISFDPNNGAKKELLRIPLEPGTSARIGDDYSWQLSPDGSHVALLRRHNSSVRLIPLNGGAARTITLKEHADPMDISWSSDSKGLFVSTFSPRGGSINRLDFNGTLQPLWQVRQAYWTGALQSPDGRKLCMWSASYTTNVWMIDNF